MSVAAALIPAASSRTWLDISSSLEAISLKSTASRPISSSLRTSARAVRSPSARALAAVPNALTSLARRRASHAISAAVSRTATRTIARAVQRLHATVPALARLQHLGLLGEEPSPQTRLSGQGRGDVRVGRGIVRTISGCKLLLALDDRDRALDRVCQQWCERRLEVLGTGVVLGLPEGRLDIRPEGVEARVEDRRRSRQLVAIARCECSVRGDGLLRLDCTVEPVDDLRLLQQQRVHRVVRVEVGIEDELGRVPDVCDQAAKRGDQPRVARVARAGVARLGELSATRLEGRREATPRGWRRSADRHRSSAHRPVLRRPLPVSRTPHPRRRRPAPPAHARNRPPAGRVAAPPCAPRR